MTWPEWPTWDALSHRAWTYFIDGHLLGHSGRITLAISLVILAEAMVRDWPKTTMYRLFVRRSGSAKVDLFYYLLQMCGLGLVLEILFTSGLALACSRAADALSTKLAWARITLPEHNLPWFVVSFLIYWIVSNFYSYWIHRFYHRPILWHAHRFHHSAEELNFLTRFRLHPLESLSRVFYVVSPLVILDASPKVLLAVTIVGDTVNFLQHSELPWKWGWIGRWLFSSPVVHQIHHSIDERHRDTNFSLCPLWDHVFGTWYPGDDTAVAYGMKDSGYERPVRQMLIDSRALYLHLASWLSSPLRRRIAERA
ncbi:hypothetical protein SPAN111604_04255 [Sphingomonas antarctica]|uniref:sterol desaturase family protein n=1 Tax=Sphingomonas antarctica TaxID=2040274 RepID=UPI0039EA3B38